MLERIVTSVDGFFKQRRRAEQHEHMAETWDELNDEITEWLDAERNWETPMARQKKTQFKETLARIIVLREATLDTAFAQLLELHSQIKQYIEHHA